jgi:hypothetical protein
MATKQFNDAGDFFADLRTGLLGPTLSESEVGGTNAVVTALGDAGWPLSWAAYGLATAYHETAHTMLPIKEFGGPNYFFRMYDPKGLRPAVAKRLGNTQSGDGARYFGRGYVQLTGRANYRRAGQKLQIDLEGDPDLALDPGVAAKVMVLGMSEGWFTSKSCATYLPGGDAACDNAGFKSARRIINGQDRAADIAGYALKFQTALQAGGWH